MNTRTAPQPADDIQDKIEERLRTMESPSHRFPTRLSRRDWILTAIAAFLCLAAVIAGAFL